MIRNFFAPFVLCVLLLVPSTTAAQESLSLSVTPPIIQLGVKPGDYWASSLKVVNVNPGSLNVYASVMDFSAEGEDGHGKFQPMREKDPALLASWIDISGNAVEIPPGQSRDIPFSIRVPADASPGGHYAAVLIGTKPFDSNGPNGPTVKISSFVSSLFLVRVSGEVEERGGIREFSTDRRMYDEPAVKFALRFENSGNVHIQPQGGVTIFNMWGKKRGEIFLNHNTNLGQVLPKSVRKFEFEWNADGSFFDIGPYTAIATLTYGKEARQNVTRTITFWIIPWKETLGVVGGFAALILLLVWGIRRYIRKALEMEIGREGVRRTPPRADIKVLARPVLQGVVDLRALKSGTMPQEKGRKWFLRRYRTVLIFVLPLCIMGALWIAGYLRSVLQPDRPFELQTEDPQISAPDKKK
jgi:hypothetical protein